MTRTPSRRGPRGSGPEGNESVYVATGMKIWLNEPPAAENAEEKGRAAAIEGSERCTSVATCMTPNDAKINYRLRLNYALAIGSFSPVSWNHFPHDAEQCSARHGFWGEKLRYCLNFFILESVEFRIVD
ncbi:hypothetical protein KM043_017411 [Ampulex compressa]|nr:hypothetical protein KM043_017411 [Ampulex compressa]